MDAEATIIDRQRARNRERGSYPRKTERSETRGESSKMRGEKDDQGA
jgi:hypothetical protein